MMATSNDFKTSNLVAKAMTGFFEQKSPILNTANRNYVGEFGSKNGRVTGLSIDVKVPKAPNVTSGLQDTVQGVTDKIVPLTINEDEDVHNVTTELSVVEELLDIVGGGKALQKPNMQAMVDNYAAPMYMALEGKLEMKAAEEFKATVYLTPIDTPDKLKPLTKFSDISQVQTFMDDMKFSYDRVGMMNNRDAQGISDSLQNMFNTAINGKITKEKLVGGPNRGRLAGFDLFSSGDLPTHIAGAQKNTSMTFQVDSVAQDGSTITFKGLNPSTAQVLVKGDLISIPSVNLIDNITKTVRRWKLVIKVSEDVTSDGSGKATVKLSDPLVFAGWTANVSALPAQNAKAELYPDHNVDYFYTKSGLSAVPLSMPDIRGAECSDIVVPKTGVPVKCVIQGQILTFQNAFRTSLLCKVKAFADYTVVLPSAV